MVCKVTNTTRHLGARIGDEIRVTYTKGDFLERIEDGFPVADEMPHLGKVAKDTDKVLSFTWHQPALTQAKGEPYPGLTALRLSIRRSSGKAIISGSSLVGSRDQNQSGRAVCRIQSNS